VHPTASYFESSRTNSSKYENCFSDGLLGGELITELNYTPSLRKAPVEKVLANLIKDGGPILHHGDSEEQQRSFESTCRKLWRFLNPSQG